MDVEEKKSTTCTRMAKRDPKKKHYTRVSDNKIVKLQTKETEEKR